MGGQRATSFPSTTTATTHPTSLGSQDVEAVLGQILGPVAQVLNCPSTTKPTLAYLLPPNRTTPILLGLLQEASQDSLSSQEFHSPEPQQPTSQAPRRPGCLHPFAPVPHSKNQVSPASLASCHTVLIPKQGP